MTRYLQMISLCLHKVAWNIQVSITISLYIHVSAGYNVTGALSHRREEVSVTISRR